MMRAKAQSVLETGEPAPFTVPTGYRAEMAPGGITRLVVSAAIERLPEVHGALVRALEGPLGVLYRRKVDRAAGDPEAEADFVGLDKAASVVLETIGSAAALVYEDARHELWIRGKLQEQVVIDQDGLVFCYPDDPVFRDVLEELGLREDPQLHTVADEDYVKHWYEASNDALEQALVTSLGLVEVPVQR